MLRSLKDLEKFTVNASDDDISSAGDFYFADDCWVVRYLGVPTSNGWIGKKALLSPHWVDRIGWAETQVHLSLPREDIKHSPEWLPEQPINREYEVRLYDDYGRPVYWPKDGPEDAGDSLSRKFGDLDGSARRPTFHPTRRIP
jgi:hypothetical protein